jgi:hypothetical protein
LVEIFAQKFLFVVVKYLLCGTVYDGVGSTGGGGGVRFQFGGRSRRMRRHIQVYKEADNEGSRMTMISEGRVGPRNETAKLEPTQRALDGLAQLPSIATEPYLALLFIIKIFRHEL